MLIRFCAAILILGFTPLNLASSFQDDSHYVKRGPRTGYYIVRPDSRLSHQLGLDDAPFSNTSDRGNRGYGADVLAYIVQALPNDFYTRRIGSLIRGRATTKDVETFFGHAQRVVSRPDGFIHYYTLQVYNPFEDRSGGR